MTEEKRQRRSFLEDFKREAVALITEQGYKVSEFWGQIPIVAYIRENWDLTPILAIFTHGCYWHQHEGCKLAYSDRNYSDKWKKKFEENLKRDKRTLEKQTEEGWRVAVIWECATRDVKAFENSIDQLHSWIIEGDSLYFESDYRKA